MKKLFFTLFLFSLATNLWAQKHYQLRSPDGKLTATISIDKRISYHVLHETDTILAPSFLSIALDNGLVWGHESKVRHAKTVHVKQEIKASIYKRNTIVDEYNELTLQFAEDFSLIYRAYNEGIAYRFVSTGKKDFVVKNEEASFHFAKDYSAHIPYVKGKFNDIPSQYFNSFENAYTYTTIQQIDEDKLAFAPLMVHLDKGKKAVLAEADLESYPGMFLVNKDRSKSLQGHFAPYPADTKQGGHNQLQQLVTAQQPYIAKCAAKAKLPWRVLIVSTEDKQLVDSDIIYKLAAPSRLADWSWVKPGKVAWEWWNHWGISNVDFEAGVNTATYKAYIDFASKNNIEYIILDEGWAVNLQADLFQVVPDIDLQELITYASAKKVDIILWAGYYAFDRDMERVCKHYSDMGVKGFKIDFMDRNDQQMVDFHYRAAEVAAKYKLLVDFHGTYIPTGMNRTYPNVINFEAVHGLEQMKWNGPELDQVTYDVTMPFIRMIAGPVDYTQGAMRNATKRTHRGINDEPMSQGTRCRQLAQYVVFESPLNMLCDSPTNYEKEQECTDFIAAIPTVWDQTVVLDSQIGQYVAVARQKDQHWYVGAMSNWDARMLVLDLSFLPAGDYVAEVYRDGANANRIAADYQKETLAIPLNRQLSVSLAQGGGYAMKIYKK